MYRAPRGWRSSFESRIYSIVALSTETGIIKSRKLCLINRLFRIIHEIFCKIFQKYNKVFCIIYKEEEKKADIQKYIFMMSVLFGFKIILDLK